MYLPCRGPNRISDPLELELQVDVSGLSGCRELNLGPPSPDHSAAIGEFISLKKKLKIKNYFDFILCAFVFCLCVCLLTTCFHGGDQVPWNWS